MSKHVVVFTMDSCPYCYDFKKMLEENEIDFIEVDIDENEEEYEMFVKITENEYVPAIMIVDEKGSSEFMAPDRDFENLEEALEKIKIELKKGT